MGGAVLDAPCGIWPCSGLWLEKTNFHCHGVEGCLGLLSRNAALLFGAAYGGRGCLRISARKYEFLPDQPQASKGRCSFSSLCYSSAVKPEWTVSVTWGSLVELLNERSWTPTEVLRFRITKTECPVIGWTMVIKVHKPLRQILNHLFLHVILIKGYPDLFVVLI